MLHTFPAFQGDGATPYATMTIDQGCGTIFKLAPPSGSGAWTVTILYDLGNSGQNPNASFVTIHNGLLYGTTTFLGSAKLGSVFTLVP